MVASAEFPRTFLASDLRIESWEVVEPYFEKLLSRPVEDREAFEKWLADWSELSAAFEEESTGRRIAYTQNTEDEAREKAYTFFIEEVEPHSERWEDKLRRRAVELEANFELPALRYEVLLRSLKNRIALFRDENVPLLTENSKLAQQYQKITGAMTVDFGGETLTVQQLGKFLEEPDRATREAAWRVGTERFLKDADRLSTLYDTMVSVRDKLAKNAGEPDFRAYTFKSMERFDYTPEDCLAFHEAILETVVPAAVELAEERKRKLGVDSLRPWDTACDADGRAPLKPFETEAELVEGCLKIFKRVDPELAEIFATMRDKQLLDLTSRKGKAPGGYMDVYREQRLPFIFMNAVGTEGDVRVLLHEGGHAFHTWACRNDPLLSYREYPIEFAEVASMAMELLSFDYLDAFHGADTARAQRTFLSRIVDFFPFMACIDGLQHWVYTHPEASIEARNDTWVELVGKFMPWVDRRGLEASTRVSWQRKLHLFEVPFYYVEYGIAQLGALQVWRNAREDYGQAVSQYRRGLALGGSRPLPELFEAAGCKFDFSSATLGPLIEMTMSEIKRLGDA